MRRVSLWIPLLLLLISPMQLVAQGPRVTVTEPAPNAVIMGSTVNVAFDVEGLTLVPSTVPLAEAGQRPEANRPGEGHLHFMLDLRPVVVWERAEPYTFTDVPGGAHQLVVELVNNDHSPLSPPVVQQIQFSTAAGTLMPNTGAAQAGGSTSSWLVAGLFALGVVVLATGWLVARTAPRR
jgi:hypothetical protein